MHGTWIHPVAMLWVHIPASLPVHETTKAWGLLPFFSAVAQFKVTLFIEWGA
jgi:hypothetical protein